MPPIDIIDRGSIHRVPANAVPLQRDVDAHWYILLGADLMTRERVLVFGTSSVGDCSDKAPCLEYYPEPLGPAGTGLRTHTHFNGCALVRTDPTLIGRPLGEIPKADHVRVAALVRDGIGWRSGLPIGSKRGQIVRLNEFARKELGTRYGVYLTTPLYSRRRRYGVLIPLIDDARNISPVPAEWVHLKGMWARNVTGKTATKGFYAAPELVVSVYHPKHVEQVLAVQLSKLEVESLEDKVAAYLAL